jgi:cytochrome c556
MIAKPTTEQLIEAVRTDLQTRVAPHVTDPTASVALAMSIAVLGSAAVRSAHELEWMLEEADAIERLAGKPAGARPALSDMAAVRAHYTRASELLAQLAEAAYDADDSDAIAEVWALLEQRREHQNIVTGGYTAVGRA